MQKLSAIRAALPALCVIASLRIAGAQAQPSPALDERKHVTLEYLGTAGWKISDGTIVILIDPYLSRLFGPQPPGRPPAPRAPGDARPAYGWDDPATPDKSVIDAHI